MNKTESAPALVATASVPRGRLLQLLGVGFGLAVIVGNTIGAGILRTPGEVAAHLPNAWLFISVWLVGGLYALLGANSIAETGTMFPRSGGQFVCVRYALGDFPGFVVAWSDWVSTCGSSALMAMVISEYAVVLLPSLAGQTTAVGTAIILSFALLQWRGLRWASLMQNFSSLLKAAVFLALIAACFLLTPQQPVAAQAAIRPEQPLWMGLILSLQAVIYTYDGWTGVIYFSEEVTQPERNIPRSLFGGALSVIFIYLLLNLAFLYVLRLPGMAGEPLVAGAAARVIFGGRGDQVIRILSVLSLLSSINACSLMASRVLFGMSRDQLITDRICGVNAGGTPTLALFLSTAVSVFFVVTGTFDQVIAVLAFFFVLAYLLSFCSLFVLRVREPDRPRPFRAWGYPWTTGIALAGSLAFLIGALVQDTSHSIYALILLALSYPVFWLIRRLTGATAN